MGIYVRIQYAVHVVIIRLFTFEAPCTGCCLSTFNGSEEVPSQPILSPVVRTQWRATHPVRARARARARARCLVAAARAVAPYRLSQGLVVVARACSRICSTSRSDRGDIGKDTVTAIELRAATPRHPWVQQCHCGGCSVHRGWLNAKVLCHTQQCIG
eukprot:COSAG02_NODE_126_length_34895_cov_10.960886_10_plen_158_part_00